ncbi:DUF2062 domain-containing protein [Arenicella sp. 4NH20-0111]|uniref:DUF2062 domain-containing protein n=1 Tax=Arenicella sp. 4NH20-0111 TaxID=3127648 RepID=UPI00333F3B74
MHLLKNLRKYLPTYTEIQQYRYLHIFGDGLKQPEVWAFNRQSTAKGVAIGLFCAFLPMPFEMVPAIFLAVLMGGNLPFALACVWLSNPLTWIPLYTPCYLLGAKILQLNPIALNEITLMQAGTHYAALWLGCLTIGLILSISTHFLISYLWRSQIRQRWKRRQLMRLARKK